MPAEEVRGRHRLRVSHDEELFRADGRSPRSDAAAVDESLRRLLPFRMSSCLYTPSGNSLQSGSLVPEPYVVVSRRENTHDTFTLTLRPVDGGTVRCFAPGQFHMLYAFGAGESA